MGNYMLTAWSTSLGWRDIGVTGADDMREAIELAEKATGCRVSHGRSGWRPDEPGFSPGTVIDAATGEVQTVHSEKARPQVDAGPPEVLKAIALALRPQKVARGD